LITALLLVLGLGLLLSGGAALVKGASGVAAQFGVSPMIVGLTIVSFGTSSPELVVNVIGALNDQTELAFGNVVGSNLANLGLVLGIAAIVRPMSIDSKLVLRELPLLLLVTAIIVVMAVDPLLKGMAPTLDRADALVLLLVFCMFLYIAIIDVLRGKGVDPLVTHAGDMPLAVGGSARFLNWMYLGIGIVGLFLGGRLTIDNGVELARILDIQSALVGLFIVAIGTSLPELVTSVVAAMRGESDIALGNVVGSNLFNILMVLPVSALVRPVTVPAGGVVDLGMSLFLAAALIPIFWIGRARLGRRVGFMLVLCYVGYAAWRTL
jgi:cation:H+ antiporter